MLFGGGEEFTEVSVRRADSVNSTIVEGNIDMVSFFFNFFFTSFKLTFFARNHVLFYCVSRLALLPGMDAVFLADVWPSVSRTDRMTETFFTYNCIFFSSQIARDSTSYPVTLARACNIALCVEVWDIFLLFDEWRICLAVTETEGWHTAKLPGQIWTGDAAYLPYLEL